MNIKMALLLMLLFTGFMVSCSGKDMKIAYESQMLHLDWVWEKTGSTKVRLIVPKDIDPQEVVIKSNGLVVSSQYWESWNSWYWIFLIDHNISGTIEVSGVEYRFSAEVPVDESYNSKNWNVEVYRDAGGNLKVYTGNFSRTSEGLI